VDIPNLGEVYLRIWGIYWEVGFVGVGGREVLLLLISSC
jgi:hypothetical protein